MLDVQLPSQLDVTLRVIPADGFAARLLAAVGPVRAQLLPQRGPLMLTLLDDQETTLRIAGALDAAGNPVTGTALGTPAWACSDPAILTLTPADDGLSCQIVTTGKLGTCTVAVSTTPPGGPLLKDSIDVTVTTDVAQSLNITADPPASRIAPAHAGAT